MGYRIGNKGVSDMVLTLLRNGKKLDIMVKPEQKIESVYGVLLENGFYTEQCRYQGSQLSVYSMRRSAYVNPILTFRQGEIYNGDILVIRVVGD